MGRFDVFSELPFPPVSDAYPQPFRVSEEFFTKQMTSLENYGIMNAAVKGPAGHKKLLVDKKGRSVIEKMERTNGVDSWKEVMLIYNSALKQVETKLEVLKTIENSV